MIFSFTLGKLSKGKNEYKTKKKKEGPVCWYDGLSCKLISIAIEGSIPFLPNYIA